MRTEEEIQKQLNDAKEKLEKAHRPDNIYLQHHIETLEWVLEERNNTPVDRYSL